MFVVTKLGPLARSVADLCAICEGCVVVASVRFPIKPYEVKLRTNIELHLVKDASVAVIPQFHRDSQPNNATVSLVDAAKVDR